MSGIFYRTLKANALNTVEYNHDDRSIFGDHSYIRQKRKRISWLCGLLIVSGVVISGLLGSWILSTVGGGAGLSDTDNEATSANPKTRPTSAKKVIDLGYVKYSGIRNSLLRTTQYRGIPYAVPPTGQNRWRHPRDIESENDFDGREIAADTAGPACYGICFSDTNCNIYAGQSEDCLTLNVLVPDHPTPKRLPVVVLIHGGAYIFGNSQLPGDALVHASNGEIILITIQYRLGAFGFLAGSEIRGDGVANAGLLDQRSALEWISRHIQAFGGDPAKVTIWGLSAGGGSAIFQMMAYGGSGSIPFRAAIPEYPWFPPLRNESSQDIVYHRALDLSGCDSLSCLRGLSPEELQNVNNNVIGSYSDEVISDKFYYYGPVVDGDFVRDLPTQAFKSGKFHHVPTMIDHNMFEGFIFTPIFEDQIEETEDAKSSFPFAGPSFYSRLYELYPDSDFENAFWQRQTWYGDFLINCPTYTIASALVDHNPNSTAVFKMLFDAGTHVHDATRGYLISGDINLPLAENRFLAKVIPSYWASFIITMDPNPLRAESAPFWSSYSAGGRGSEESGESVGFSVMTVTEDSIDMKADADASARCDFFLANAAVIRV